MSKLTTGRAMAFERSLAEDAIMLPQYRKLGGMGIALAKALNRPFEFERSDTAYSKTLDFLPANWKGAAVESIGGKTVVWNQLATAQTTTITAGASTRKEFSSWITLVTGHKYMVSVNQKTTQTSNTRNTLGIYNRSTSEYTYESATTNYNLNAGVRHWIYTSTFTGDGQAVIWCNGANVDTTYEDFAFIDLTLMFGAGNEPSTVAEFQQVFPSIDPAYNAGQLISAGVTSIVSKDAENATLATLPIPAAVQALPGYGWSAGSVCNEVDWENKKYIQRVGSVDLGTCDWIKLSEAEWNCFYTKTLNSNKGKGVDNLLCSHYIQSTMYNTQTDKIVCGNANNGFVYIRDSAYQSGTESAFQTAMSGVILYYELATPVETDISAYLTDDNLIEVEAGGTLTFENQLGDDYRIPVPTKVKYQRRGE